MSTGGRDKGVEGLTIRDREGLTGIGELVIEVDLIKVSSMCKYLTLIDFFLVEFCSQNDLFSSFLSRSIFRLFQLLIIQEIPVSF
jgi:hypothetical protein